LLWPTFNARPSLVVDAMARRRHRNSLPRGRLTAHPIRRLGRSTPTHPRAQPPDRCPAPKPSGCDPRAHRVPSAATHRRPSQKSDRDGSSGRDWPRIEACSTSSSSAQATDRRASYQSRLL
jgi:hypothetical protein